MTSFSNNLRSRIHFSDALQRLLLINISVFLILRILNAITALFITPIFNFISLSEILAVPADPATLLRRPWSVITYMFYHWEVSHIFFNMLWLYWMGKIFQEYLGNKKLVGVYLLGGIAGAIAYIISFNVFPLFSPVHSYAFALGASASVLAITVATATLLPEYPIQLLFFGSVKLKWIALISILLDLINVSGDNAGGHIAHLGGALFGYSYIRLLKSGTDLTAWVTAFFGKFQTKKNRTFTNTTRKDETYNLNKKARQEKMDEILDKISKSGYGSLSNEEKEFLFRISRDE